MTIGIYALYWQEQDLIYVGQSQSIEDRFKEHIRKLKSIKHSNYKVQNTFNSYGEPNLVIVQECLVNDLNELEIYWTKEFNSINNGLNIIEAGKVGWGVNSNASKYTKRQILKVFSLLINRFDLSQEDIALRCKVSTSVCADIQISRNHLWLKENYPDKHLKLSKRTNKCNTLGFKAVVKNSNGEEFKVYQITSFVKQHFPNIHYKTAAEGLRKVISGTRNSYFGYYKVMVQE